MYDALGEKQKALDYLNQSLPLSRATGYKEWEAVTLNNIGRVYSDLGQKQKALDYYNQSLPLSQSVEDKAEEATTLNNIGAVYDALGQKQKALEYYNQSLPLSQAVEDKAGEATTLNNIGLVYSALGERQKALDYFNQSLPLTQATGDKAGEAITLNNIGLVYLALGEKQKALDYLNQSLPLTQAVGKKAQEAATLNNIGGVYLDLGQKQKALEYFNQSLPLRRATGDKAGEATTLNNIGAVYSALGEKQTALDYFNQSLPLSRATGDKAGEAVTLSNIARIERTQGNLNEALTQIKTAINIIEELRSKIGSQELRASYFAQNQDYYQFYIDLLMELHQQNSNKGYDAQALHASERARARSLVELLAEANADIRQGVDPELLEKESNIQQKLNAQEYQRHQLVSNGQYTNKQLDPIKQEINTLLDQLQQIKAEIRIKSPGYAALKYPEPLTLPEIQQQVLDEETLLLQYSLGEERSFLWAVTQTGINSYELPPQAEIEAAAKELRGLLQSENSEVINSEAAKKLSQMLLAPVAEQLNGQRLLVVGDGILQTIPFAVLPIPGKTSPLLVNHEIVTLPSATAIAVSRRDLKNRTPAPKTLAVLADPVFQQNDPRFQEDYTQSPLAKSPSSTSDKVRQFAVEIGVTLNRLEYSSQEAKTILALVPENQQTQALGFDASRLTATSSDLSQYQIVHLATHGLLNTEKPELSGLVLSLFNQEGKEEDGFLRLHDIYNLNLPAELVVLSACETGLGQEVKGEGLVGLTRGFMYAGAKGVAVSLWSVNDAGTAIFMEKYYQKMLQEGLTSVAAMRAAQLEMWQTEQWSSPYYWSAFVVQGEWRE
ncbi:CHAT domain-containing protein [Lyngbya aestuarii]|uniref:CHAT domain-containing protein n=1 Tax=Lyngbya aestuarii TaxID=118322 RepID=UPI00403D8B21